MRYYLFILASIAVTLAACAQKKHGDQLTPSGYPFTYHINKEGPTPQPGDYVYFQLYIRNEDSVVYSTRRMGQQPKAPFPDYSLSTERPAPQMDALRVMSEGDSITLFYRIDTLPQKPRGFENSDMVYYDIVLEAIKSPSEFQQDMAQMESLQQLQEEAMRTKEPEVEKYIKDVAQRYVNGEITKDLKTTESGLKYYILEQGTGPQAKSGSIIEVHYYGVLPSGKMFDNSYRTGRPYRFFLGQGQVIPGWDEGFTLLKEGATAIFFIPSPLGYGEAGSPPVIPSNSELIFYVELKSVKG